MPVFYLIIGAMLLANVAWGCWAWFRLSRKPLKIFAVTFAVVQAAGLAAIFLSRDRFPAMESFIPRWWSSAILIWHLVILLLWLLWRLVMGLWAGTKAVGRAIAPSQTRELPAVREPDSQDWTRREFLRTTAVLTPPMLCLGSSAFAEYQLEQFRVRRMDLTIPNLPPALDGLTIAHVTDTHIGRFTRGRILEEIVETTNGLNADIVAMTGDLINGSLRAMPAALEMTRALRARHMVVTCEGNHDLIDDPRAFYREAEAGGLPLLRGETAEIEVRGQKVQVLGMPWSRNEEQMERDAEALLSKRDPSAWPLVLTHHPHSWDYLQDIPLTLAGHTHGGQLMLNDHMGAGSILYRYWSGLYRQRNRTLVVSNGTGNWFPVRVQAPAEIIHLTLRRQVA